MHEHGKSDSSIVPQKPANKTGQPEAEQAEGRGLAKGNPRQQNASLTQRRSNAPSALEWIREAAAEERWREQETLAHR